MSYEVTVFEDMLGQTLLDVSRKGDDEIIFTVDDGSKYMMRHDQDCCESVYIEDIVGDLNDLVGSPLLKAEEVSFNHPDELDEKTRVWNRLQSIETNISSEDSQTWTYYKFSTIKGSVSIRWYGSSNGYYSEIVTFSSI